jgi:ribosomal protein S27AE
LTVDSVKRRQRRCESCGNLQDLESIVRVEIHGPSVPPNMYLDVCPPCVETATLAAHLVWDVDYLVFKAP